MYNRVANVEYSIECTTNCSWARRCGKTGEWEVSAEVLLFALCHIQVRHSTFLPCHSSLHVINPLGQDCFSCACLGLGIKFS